jgi:hypothetical protein
MMVDLLRKMLQITGDIGLNAVDFPALSTFCKAFNRSSRASVECCCVAKSPSNFVYVQEPALVNPSLRSCMTSPNMLRLTLNRSPAS